MQRVFDGLFIMSWTLKTVAGIYVDATLSLSNKPGICGTVIFGRFDKNVLLKVTTNVAVKISG